MKRFLSLALLLAVLFTAAGCHDNSADLRHQAQVDALMEQLSIREKVAQLFVIEISREPSDATRALQDSLIRDYGVGCLILMRGPIGPFIERTNELQSLAKLPLLVAQPKARGTWAPTLRKATHAATLRWTAASSRSKPS